MLAYVLILIGFLPMADAKPIMVADVYPSMESCQQALVLNLNATIKAAAAKGIDTAAVCVPIKRPVNL